jgi:hypothetical protein
MPTTKILVGIRRAGREYHAEFLLRVYISMSSCCTGKLQGLPFIHNLLGALSMSGSAITSTVYRRLYVLFNFLQSNLNIETCLQI